ncbi:MFS transporter [Janthinobacterium lividum]|uniref:MFS transporter n=1 Tax=Janthinobacterium lividum TaxID=29581 RepID=UPI00087386F4|nr:MFS transporter [Janthinobacterium lividum]MCC7713083.1 MFS transporter [Janthinobacterium lividum]OEZ57397.1 multidrug resistance protein Stp [Janthinobacterium lividum]WQE31517.1 MFS transporter [Janthinobacterium lividum]STQ97045.1 Spectinomycin tetracycline efflux pump [Janthinobacterium lividum]
MLLSHRQLCLVLLCTTQFVALLDFSITMIPLPQIQQSLGFTSGGLQWVINAYGVAIAGFLLLGGRAADMFGRRRVFITGLLLFTAASLLGGFSHSPAMLVATRALQGFGAAMFSPAAFSLLLAVFPEPAQRNRALGAWTAVAASGFVAGLILGGFITDMLGWRWVLWINVPVGLLVLALSPALPLGRPDADSAAAGGTLDVWGALLVASGAATLVFAFANSEHVGLAHPLTFALVALALALLALFVWVEGRVAAPLMPLAVFRRRSTGGANIVSLLANTALGPTFVVVALAMQEVLGFSATRTGLGLLPMASAFTLASAWAGPALIARCGTKPVIIGGMLLFIGGLAMLGSSLATLAAWGASILPGTVLAGIGYGLAFPAWTVAGIDGVPEADHGLAGGMLTTTQEVGSAVGLAVGVAVSIAVLAGGGTAAQGYSSAILVSACLVVAGLACAIAILPGKAARQEAAP